MFFPTLDQELNLIKKGHKLIAGVDEVGRGPLAGPVVAAAVAILNLHDNGEKFQQSLVSSRKRSRLFYHMAFNDWDLLKDPGLGMDILFKEVRDSKKMSVEKREMIYRILTVHPWIIWGTGIVSEKVIDEINILEASLLAMKIAIGNLKKNPDFILLDGNHLLSDFPVSQSAIIKGDAKVFSIAASSVIAKVTRDRLLAGDYHKKYPQYGFDKHKGYGTKFHLEMLEKYGISPAHRLSFAPVRLAVKE